tara:strand:- start:12833 stop:14584 length:1752 start_codon:yes stop_codon:yes gene_type:complete
MPITKLSESLRWSRKQMEPFRANRVRFLKQFVGANYSNTGAQDKVPLNMIEMTANVYLRHLVAHMPKVLVSTQHMELKPHSFMFEMAMNHLLDEVLLEDTLRMAAGEGLFGMGLVKVGMAPAGQVEVNGYTHDVGQPFADIVELDDWVHDMTARRWDQCSYMGSKIRLPLDYVKESGLYNWDEDKITSTHIEVHNEQGDARASEISRGSGSYEEGEWKKYVEVWELWLPEENSILTVSAPADDEGIHVLREVDYDGPENGPYHVLRYTDVPGQTVPLPPIAQLIDEHELINELYVKLGKQAKRQKTNLLVAGAAADDANRIINAEDGAGIRSDHPDGAREMSWGGPNQMNFAFAIDALTRYSWMAGNLDALGGLGPQSETLGQDEMLAAGASKKMQDMQASMLKFTKSICEALGWHLFHDPLIEVPMTRKFPMGVEVPVTYSEEQREGDFLDYNFSIDPYSMQYETPQNRLAKIKDIVGNLVLPLLPYSQDVSVKLSNLARIAAKYSNIPEIEEILEFGGPPQGREPTGPVGQPPAPTDDGPNTSVRINRPGGTRTGRDAALMQTLMGAGVQDSEMAQVGAFG